MRSTQAQIGFKRQFCARRWSAAGCGRRKRFEVLAGEPWAYRNRIRLAFDASGQSRLSRTALARCGSDWRMPHRCAAAGESCAGVCAGSRAGLRRRCGRRRLRCSAMRRRLRCWSACLLRERCKGWLGRVWRSALQRADSRATGMELVCREAVPVSAAHLCAMGRGFARLSRGGVRLSRGQRRVFSGKSLAGGCAGGTCDGAGWSGALAWDLFAGVGLFARRLAAGFERVFAVESAPAATDALKQNLQRNRGDSVAKPTLEFSAPPAKTGRTVPDFACPI